MIFSNKKRLPTWRRRRTGPRRDTSTPASPLYHFAIVGKMVLETACNKLATEKAP